jgi:hypothetical protein
MRARARQLRRIADMAHDPQMIDMLLKMADEVELDASRLEARVQRGEPDMPLPPQAQ